MRHFRPHPLPDGLLPRLLDLADAAPSVGLSQPWRFVELRSAAARAALRANFARANAAALAAQAPADRALYARLKLEGLDTAPCLLAVFVEPEPGQGRGLGRASMPETAAYSAVLAIHTLWLAARAEGLGLGWVSILEAEALAPALELPPQWRLVACLCLGFPAAEEAVPELERLGWERRQATPRLLR